MRFWKTQTTAEQAVAVVTIQLLFVIFTCSLVLKVLTHRILLVQQFSGRTRLGIFVNHSRIRTMGLARSCLGLGFFSLEVSRFQWENFPSPTSQHFIFLLNRFLTDTENSVVQLGYFSILTAGKCLMAILAQISCCINTGWRIFKLKLQVLLSLTNLYLWWPSNELLQNVLPLRVNKDFSFPSCPIWVLLLETFPWWKTM